MARLKQKQRPEVSSGDGTKKRKLTTGGIRVTRSETGEKSRKARALEKVSRLVKKVSSEQVPRRQLSKSKADAESPLPSSFGDIGYALVSVIVEQRDGKLGFKLKDVDGRATVRGLSEGLGSHVMPNDVLVSFSNVDCLALTFDRILKKLDKAKQNRSKLAFVVARPSYDRSVHAGVDFSNRARLCTACGGVLQTDGPSATHGALAEPSSSASSPPPPPPQQPSTTLARTGASDRATTHQQPRPRRPLRRARQPARPVLPAAAAAVGEQQDDQRQHRRSET